MNFHEQESETHIYFDGGILSNFSTCRSGCAVDIGDMKIAFKTSEHAFMALKAYEFGDMAALKQIIDAPTPRDVRNIGDRIKGYNKAKWERVCYDRMKQCLVAKFTQNENYRKALLDTGTKVLVYACYNRFWGVGVSMGHRELYSESTWNGQNLLGRCLMEVRSEIAKGNYGE